MIRNVCFVLLCVPCVMLGTIENDLYKISQYVEALNASLKQVDEYSMLQKQLEEQQEQLERQGYELEKLETKQKVTTVYNAFWDDIIQLRQNYPSIALKDMPMMILLRDDRVVNRLYQEIEQLQSSVKEATMQQFPAIYLFRSGLSAARKFLYAMKADYDALEMNADRWLEYLDDMSWWSYQIRLSRYMIEGFNFSYPHVGIQMLERIDSSLYEIGAQDAVSQFQQWLMSDFLFEEFVKHYERMKQILDQRGDTDPDIDRFIAFYAAYIEIVLKSYFLVYQEIYQPPQKTPKNLYISRQELKDFLTVFYNTISPYVDQSTQEKYKNFIESVQVVIPQNGLSWVRAQDFAEAFYVMFAEVDTTSTIVTKQQKFIDDIKPIFERDAPDKQNGSGIYDTVMRLRQQKKTL